MKLRKMILRENHEVMKDKEMKLILGGDYMPSKGTCQKASDVCSGTCEDIRTINPLTGVVTITKMYCQAIIGADPTNFFCACGFK